MEMKETILRLLREAGDSFVSGQLLCETVGVSRQAVWKAISKLKESGYDIESVPNRGYRLKSVPDTLFAPDIESRFAPNCYCRRVECHLRIDSTNTRAKQLAELGEPEGVLVVAEEQTAGKGRRGRSWTSPGGVGIFMSLLLRPPLEPRQASSITLVAALAVARGIEQTCGVMAQIKWPNDIVIHDKKICGILTETSSEPDYIHYVVVGIGINANTPEFPPEFSDHASSIYLETGHLVDRQALIAAVMDAFTEYYGRYLQTGDLSLLREEYDRLLINRDRQVRIFHGLAEEVSMEETQVGTARGIDAQGALLVETEDGIQKVVSGEVSVRGMDGYV
jgi:BirA family biotin operon repressor/biotin-[acetyl-CoA-carboxylase] ligase